MMDGSSNCTDRIAPITLHDYRARYYDSYINLWVQPDSIIPNPSNPQTFNRYAYVLGNPLKYIDSTGHIAESEVQAANLYLAQLSTYDVEIEVDWGWSGSSQARKWENGLWTLDEMDVVLQSVLDMAGAMGGEDAFRSALGGVKIQQKTMNAWGRGWAHHVNLNEAGFTTWTVVHELGHAWDFANGRQLSRDLKKAVGANNGHPIRRLLDPKNPNHWYDPGQGPPPCGIDAGFNRYEDFAESVTAYVYPLEAKNKAQTRGWPYVDTKRNYNYSDFTSTPRGKFIDSLVVKLP